MACEKQKELRKVAHEILERIALMAEEQVKAMKNEDDERLMAIDIKLETEFGAKERAFGALFEHRKQHDC
ncbi:MAG: hypothetical protein ACRD7E_12220 [Bryobacteraceae bacterium]